MAAREQISFSADTGLIEKLNHLSYVKNRPRADTIRILLTGKVDDAIREGGGNPAETPAACKKGVWERGARA